MVLQSTAIYHRNIMMVPAHIIRNDMDVDQAPWTKREATSTTSRHLGTRRRKQNEGAHEKGGCAHGICTIPIMPEEAYQSSVKNARHYASVPRARIVPCFPKDAGSLKILPKMPSDFVYLSECASYIAGRDWRARADARAMYLANIRIRWDASQEKIRPSPEWELNGGTGARDWGEDKSRLDGMRRGDGVDIGLACRAVPPGFSSLSPGVYLRERVREGNQRDVRACGCNPLGEVAVIPFAKSVYAGNFFGR